MWQSTSHGTTFAKMFKDAITKLSSNMKVQATVLNVKSLVKTNSDFSLPLKVSITRSPLRLATNADNLSNLLNSKLASVQRPANPPASFPTLSNAMSSLTGLCPNPLPLVSLLNTRFNLLPESLVLLSQHGTGEQSPIVAPILELLATSKCQGSLQETMD
jgi:hypothetical protein